MVNIIIEPGTKKSIEKTIFAHVQHFLLWKQNLAKSSKILNLHNKEIFCRDSHICTAAMRLKINCMYNRIIVLNHEQRLTTQVNSQYTFMSMPLSSQRGWGTETGCHFLHAAATNTWWMSEDLKVNYTMIWIAVVTQTVTTTGAVAHFVTCNLPFSGQLPWCALKAVMWNDRNFMEVIFLH